VVALHLHGTPLSNQWDNSCSCRGTDHHEDDCTDKDLPLCGALMAAIKAEVEDLTMGEFSIQFNTTRVLTYCLDAGPTLSQRLVRL
jgi:hypothetical protein